jgi:MmeI, target recognition domain
MSGRDRSTVTGFDAFGGNMPFMGGRRIAGHCGERYAAWLTEHYRGTGNTDYVGYFFLRASSLLARRGTLGLIATNAIADSDNRRTVLARLIERGLAFYDVRRGIPWPGTAAVLIALLHAARGRVLDAVRDRRLNGRRVEQINSRLMAGAEWPEAKPLSENNGRAFIGCFLRGDGFILSDAEAAELLAAHPREREVVRPFMTGEDLNSRPDQSPSRHVIAFFDRTLQEAEQFPAALALVNERVRPARMRLKTTGADADHRRYWWRFANTRKQLREAAARLPRLLATARVSKHVMFSFIDSDVVPSEQVVAFATADFADFAVLQSRVHACWVRLLATHMGEGNRYSTSECFDTFPFPAASEPLRVAGARVYDTRRRYMIETGQGLTQTYNLLADEACHDARVVELRQLHEELDRAVLEAYGWPDVGVPPYCAPEENSFETAVIDRLFDLNAQRARDQERHGRPS